MPANTTHGLPYPLPTEPVAEGAQAIRNLAEALDPLTFRPACLARTNTTINCNSGAWTFFPLAAEDFDTDTMHDLVTNNSRVTIKTAGIYLLVGTIGGAFVAAGARLGGVSKNAAGVPGGGIIASSVGPAGTANTNFGLAFSTLAQCIVGDYFELQLYHDGGAVIGCSARLGAVKVA